MELKGVLLCEFVDLCKLCYMRCCMNDGLLGGSFLFVGLFLFLCFCLFRIGCFWYMNMFFECLVVIDVGIISFFDVVDNYVLDF